MEFDKSTSPPPPSPVTWQTALWTLIPLLLNTCGQPSGRILSLCPKHDIFPRSYPLYTLFDLLSIACSLSFMIFHLGISPRMAIDLLMHYRYKDCDEDNGLKALRKWRWLRWVMFALGGMQPAIKLATFKGLPVTKAIGMIWVISWVAIELLGLLARDVDFGPEGEGPLTLRQHTALVASRKIRSADGMLEDTLKPNIYHISRCMNFMMCFSMSQDLLFGGYHRFSFEMNLVYFGAVACGVGVGTVPHMWQMLRGQGLGARLAGPAYMGLDIFMLVLGLGLTGYFFLGLRPAVIIPADPILICGHMISMHLFTVVNNKMSQRPLVRKIFAIDQANCPECEGSRRWSAFWLLTNLMFGVLWYAFRYSSEGTHNPGWTYVFGGSCPRMLLE